MVASPRPLDPFVENGTHMGCSMSFLGCHETRKWSRRVFEWLAKQWAKGVGRANGEGRI